MKPLLALDLETTGVSITRNAIFQVGIYSPFEVEQSWLIKPWEPIPPEIEKLTGVTNEAVSRCPEFKAVAPMIRDVLRGADLLVFNGYNFDIPFLYEEFARAGIEWDLNGVEAIDVGNIFKRKEERTLSAAVKFYCGREHVGAHGALADCEATYAVANAMHNRYPGVNLLALRKETARYSRYDEERLSFDGKVILKNGVACFNFGKHKDAQTPVLDDPSYAQWMIGADFPAQTKAVLRKVLQNV